MNLEELEKLFALKEKGILTQEEFAAQKAKILNAPCNPDAELVLPKKSPWAWYAGVIKKYVTFSGRATRSEYWYFVLINVLVTIALNIVGMAFSSLIVLSTLYALFILLPALAVAFRRLHDTGRSGWWIGGQIIVGLVAGAILGWFIAANAHTGKQPGDAFNATMGVFLLLFIAYQIVLLVFMCLKSNPCPNKYGSIEA